MKHMANMAMDHSGMDHPGMDHPGMDHDMPMDMCKMNMLFTWDWKNTCVVYKWWHVKTLAGFLGTLVAITALSMGYELARCWIFNWRNKGAAFNASNFSGRSFKAFKAKSSLLYAFQVGYSFMLMLVFMTYNGWYMLAVALGAGIGHYLWGNHSENLSLSCH
ncbi:putative copper transport protein [Clavispora lusitaniae]|nr:putative copper transport protein [Clavispora lusitaniae]QFZ32488.1 putative copper transport protein [Clavispora lusitaniae]QFZ38157.1 putative copper transport protein [Clavispora lusitaniae]QFZ43840.1 putative copper transport protein [Clavispora lusitaniae]QFZ49517.1 putative copper transport protein [Clavispora lusitaniae]